MIVNSINSQSFISLENLIHECLKNDESCSSNSSLFMRTPFDLSRIFQNREHKDCCFYDFYYLSKETRDQLSSIIHSENNELDKILEREKIAIQARHEQIALINPLTEDDYVKCEHIVIDIAEKQNKKLLIKAEKKQRLILVTQIIQIYKEAEEDNPALKEHDTPKSILSDLIRKSEIYDKICYFLKYSSIACFIYHKNEYEILPKTIWDNTENIFSLMATFNVRHYIDDLELIEPVFVQREDRSLFLSGINDKSNILFNEYNNYFKSNTGNICSINKEFIQNYCEKWLGLLSLKLRDGTQEFRAAEFVYFVAKHLFTWEEISSISREQAKNLITILATGMNFKIIDQEIAKGKQEKNYNFNYLNKKDIESIVVLLQSLECANGPKKIDYNLQNTLIDRIKNFTGTF